MASDTEKNLPDELSLNEVLAAIAEGQKVVFVDTREYDEYTEVRLPRAVHLPLRNINASAAETLADADMVVAYCIKDFRGYEAAYALRTLGINASIMQPYGIRGWIEQGLPVVKGSSSEEEMSAYLSLLALANKPL